MAGVEPIIMDRAFVPQSLKLWREQICLNDIQLIELNEAFAAQVIAVIQEAKLNRDIVNVNGGLMPWVIPLGCTGQT